MLGLVARRRRAYAQKITDTCEVTERISERNEPDSDDAFCREIERLVELTGRTDEDDLTDLTAI